MSDQVEENAEQARFAAFVETTLPDERDCIAFREFEVAIIKATECASMIDPYDGGLDGEREHAALKLALSGMLYRVLPRVDLGVLIANAAGIGYALRYGIIEPHREALDSIADTDAYRELAEKGSGRNRQTWLSPPQPSKPLKRKLRLLRRRRGLGLRWATFRVRPTTSSKKIE